MSNQGSIDALRAAVAAGQEFGKPCDAQDTPVPKVDLKGDDIYALLIDIATGSLKAPRGIQIQHARIVGDLNLENLTLESALYLKHCDFEDTFAIRHFNGISLIIEGSTFLQIIDARDARLSNQLVARSCQFERPVLFRDCEIGGQANFQGSEFSYVPDEEPRNWMEEQAFGQTFSLARSTLGSFRWQDISFPRGAQLDLTDANLGSFVGRLDQANRAQSWPEPGNLLIKGVNFGRIDHEDEEDLVKWLALGRGFAASTYQNAASALSKSGRERGEQRLLSESRKRETDGISNVVKRWLYKVVFGITGYGKQPGIALLATLALFLAAWGMAYQAQSAGTLVPSRNDLQLSDCFYRLSECKSAAAWTVIKPTGSDTERAIPKDYPKFSSFSFTFERFSPGTNFGQTEAWRFGAEWQEYAHRFLALLGLFFAGVFVATITGLLRPRGSDQGD